MPYDIGGAAPAAVCLEAHDLVVAKMVAGRDKDIAFAAALLTAGLVDLPSAAVVSSDVPKL